MIEDGKRVDVIENPRLRMISHVLVLLEKCWGRMKR